jgi:hypothetical protein
MDLWLIYSLCYNDSRMRNKLFVCGPPHRSTARTTTARGRVPRRVGVILFSGDTHLNIRFVNVETGKVLWAAEAHDPRTFTWSTNTKTSIVHTVRKAIKLLKKDLLKSSG